ncbi:MAG: hypothetical protein LC112_00935 [Flavobacteriales bacterium]|nr:hypothetical protein [Flavobacteriales bacterium]
MKRLAVISAVVFTTLTLNSCRQADEVLSPEEQATLQKVRDSSNVSSQRNYVDPLNNNQGSDTASFTEDGEIAPPPKK